MWADGRGDSADIEAVRLADVLTNTVQLVNDGVKVIAARTAGFAAPISRIS